jgi:hypothetical protein
MENWDPWKYQSLDQQSLTCLIMSINSLRAGGIWMWDDASLSVLIPLTSPDFQRFFRLISACLGVLESFQGGTTSTTLRLARQTSTHCIGIFEDLRWGWNQWTMIPWYHGHHLFHRHFSALFKNFKKRRKLVVFYPLSWPLFLNSTWEGLVSWLDHHS